MMLYLLPLLLVMFIVFSICGYCNMPTVYGTLLGGATAALNFYLLALSVEKSVRKGGKGSSGIMGLSYTLRLALIGLIVVFAIKAPYINYLAAIIPLVFPRIIILVMNIRRGKKNDRT